MQHSTGNSPTNTEPLPNSPKGGTPRAESADTTILGTPISSKVLELNNSVEGSDDAEKTVAVDMEDDEKEKPLIELFGRKRKASSEMQKKDVSTISTPTRQTLQLMPQGEDSNKKMKGDESSPTEAVIQGLLDLNQEVEENENSANDDVELEAIVVPFADEDDEVMEPSVEGEGEVESDAADSNEVNPSVVEQSETEEESDIEGNQVEPDDAVENTEVEHSAVDTNEVEPSPAAEEGQHSGANKDEGESSHAAEKKAKGTFEFDLNELPPEEDE